jgi:hypothetical protein
MRYLLISFQYFGYADEQISRRAPLEPRGSQQVFQCHAGHVRLRDVQMSGLAQQLLSCSFSYSQGRQPFWMGPDSTYRSCSPAYRGQRYGVRFLCRARRASAVFDTSSREATISALQTLFLQTLLSGCQLSLLLNYVQPLLTKPPLR